MERTPSAPPAPTSTEHDQVHKDLKSHYRSASVPILNTDDDVASNPIKAPSALPPPLFAPGLSLSPHLRTSTALSPGSPVLRNAVPLQTGASQKFKSALVSWAEDVILKEQVPPEWGSNEDVWTRVARFEKALAQSEFAKIKIKSTISEEVFQRALKRRKNLFLVKLERMRANALGLLIPLPNPPIAFPALPLPSTLHANSNNSAESEDEGVLVLNSDGEEDSGDQASVGAASKHLFQQQASNNLGLISPNPSSESHNSPKSRPSSALPVQQDFSLVSKSRIPPPPVLPLVLPTLSIATGGSTSAPAGTSSLLGRPGGRVVAIPQRRPRLHRAPSTTASAPASSSSNLPVPVTPSTPAIFAPEVTYGRTGVTTVATTRPLGPSPTLQPSHQVSPFVSPQPQDKDEPLSNSSASASLPTPSSPPLTRPQSLRQHLALYGQFSKNVPLPIEFGPAYLAWKQEFSVGEAMQRAWDLAVDKEFWSHCELSIEEARAVFHLLDVYGTVAIPKEGDKEGGGKSGVGEFVVFPKETYVDLNPRFGSTPPSASSAGSATSRMSGRNPASSDRQSQQPQQRLQPPPSQPAIQRRSVSFSTAQSRPTPASAPAAMYSLDANSFPGQQISRKRPSSPPPSGQRTQMRRISTDSTSSSRAPLQPQHQPRKFVLYEGPPQLVAANANTQHRRVPSGGAQFYPTNSTETQGRQPHPQPYSVVQFASASRDTSDREQRFQTFMGHLTALAKIQFKMMEESRIGGANVLEACWAIMEREKERSLQNGNANGDA